MEKRDSQTAPTHKPQDLLWRIHEAVSRVLDLPPVSAVVIQPADITNSIPEQLVRKQWEKLYNDAKNAMKRYDDAMKEDTLDPDPHINARNGILKYLTPHVGLLLLHRLVDPSVFVTFAQSRGLGLPPELEELANNASTMTDVPAKASNDDPSDSERGESIADAESSKNEETLSKLFEPVTVQNLEKMFATGKDRWKVWAGKAKANGLIEAREGRAMFNPYKAALWFLRQGVEGWDLARCRRTLANNLPDRSQGERHLLNGDLE